MNISEKLAAKTAELEGLKAAIENNDAEAIEQGEKLAAEIDGLKADAEKAEKAASLLKRMGSKPEKTDAPKKGIAGICEKAAQVDRRVKGWSVNGTVSAKAYNDTVTSVQMTDYDRDVIVNTRRPSVLDVFGDIEVAGNAITYFTENGFDGNSGAAPAVVAEGAKKPQGSDGFTSHTVALSKVAVYTKESDEILEDEPFLASVLRDVLRFQIEKKKAAVMVAAAAGATGIQTSTYDSGTYTGDNKNIAEAILHAKGLIKSNTPFEPDAVIINPADWETLVLSKDSIGQYMGGGYFTAAYANGEYSAPARIWGIPVYESGDVSQGTVLVLAARESVKRVHKGETDVRIFEENEDDVLYNRVTIRAEERMVPVVKYPLGIVKITAATA
jgi:HK97 family phage major capsid protein